MTEDRDLRPSDLQTLSDRDGVASFFAKLGYRIDARIRQTPEALGISPDALLRQIRQIERIADQENGALQVYFVELSSVTQAAVQGLARAFRNRAGNYLLVLTSDFEQLDFVLLERVLPVNPEQGIATRQVGVRPRSITVNRRNPDLVQLRVLRRFTYTEADAEAQFEKLLSAYTVADWSEKFFNNRALFSDYYLNERLRTLPEWAEDPKPTYRKLRDLYSGSPIRFAGKKESEIRKELFEPVLAALGFEMKEGNSSKSAEVEPDYRLYSRNSPASGILSAECLAYVWNRSLDAKDETRDLETPDENPSFAVVSLLERGDAPWAIVTNGKIWRLYSAKAHSRATNYYEIDLEEALASADPSEFFRYFWLLFRAASFELKAVQQEGEPRQLCFLDALLEESEAFAKGLGDRLKDRVFEQIFPHVAEGFIEGMGGASKLLALSEEKREALLARVFQGTLTLLYRLLFLFYAESRDLLPVREVRGYWEISLTRLVREIASAAETIEDLAPVKIGKKYRSDSTALYDRVFEICRVVDKGSAPLNVPLYNGGLFLTEVAKDEHTEEAENDRFLANHKVPDSYLALGLDLMARGVDDKRGDLVFIDYKSLGVRQLGSIYEGLLEFKLRIATEKMAVVKGKKTEEVLPYQEAKKAKLKIVTKRRGKEAEERTYSRGDVYLENDRRERKATGSYYTPDYIVKYIVENTVGPTLEEKFEVLRPKLREAQKALTKEREKAAALRKSLGTSDDPEREAYLKHRSLVDELFKIRVLDPAMGSGHFLVEAVDFITDRMLRFLNAFPWNPIQYEIGETRRTILEEMGSQGVIINREKLTDVNLLKRHVLKRCIYGVDLNPMAVELAKVSLWLDCFTLGAPLSFLDHHLRCGNSLIGCTIEEIDMIRMAKGQLTLSGTSDWQGLTQAVQGMIAIGALADVTAGQVTRSRKQFESALVDVEIFKRVLDLHAARWFVDIANGRGNGKKLTANIFEEMLRSGDLFEWAHGRVPTPLSDTAEKGLAKSIVERADSKSIEMRFFHWELEFPEVFYGPRQGTQNAVERLDSGGFDAIVGNPPYVNVKRGIEKESKGFFEWRYLLATGQWDEGALFYETTLGSAKSQGLSQEHGSVGLIVPKPFFLSESYQPLRELLIAKGLIVYGPCGDCFPDAGVEACIGIVRKSVKRGLRIVDGRGGFQKLAEVSADLIGRIPFLVFTYMLPEEGFSALFSDENKKLAALGNFVHWTRGVEAGKHDDAISILRSRDTVPLIVGEAMIPYHAPSSVSIKPDEKDEAKFKRRTLYEMRPKLLVRRVAPTLIAAVDDTGAYVLNTIYVGELDRTWNPYALVALLNAGITRGILRATFNLDDVLFPYIRVSQLDRLPVPREAGNDPELVKLGKELSKEALSEDAKTKWIARVESRVKELYGLTEKLSKSLSRIGNQSVGVDGESQQ
jgi:hypothetical protein